MVFDPIALLEEAYRPRGEPGAWLRANALEIIAPLDEEGFGALTYFVRDGSYEPSDVHYQPGSLGHPDPGEVFASLQTGVAAMTPAQFESAMRVMQQPGAHGFVETFGEIIDEARDLMSGGEHSVRDTPAVLIPTGEDRVAVVTTSTPRLLALGPRDRLLWTCTSIHLGAACRLSARAAGADASDVEAVVDPSGRVLDARGQARTAAACSRLRDGVQRAERARTREGRADPVTALDLWPALFAGRWSLVEHVDSDGRRFVLARRNDPERAAPYPLTRRQRQVLFYASVGWSLKQIAYALGLASEGSVSLHLSTALKKIGLASRAELIRVTSQWATTVIASRRAGTDGNDRDLTAAEREVAEHVIAGCSNQQIAEKRGVSVRTIANQLASIYRKLGLQDRHDLVRWLSSRQRE